MAADPLGVGSSRRFRNQVQQIRVSTIEIPRGHLERYALTMPITVELQMRLSRLHARHGRAGAVGGQLAGVICSWKPSYAKRMFTFSY
jgi:hypothetical protein